MQNHKNVFLRLVLRLSLRQKFHFYLVAPILMIVFRFYFILNYSKLNNINKHFFKINKLKERFILGSYLGYTISRFILKNEKKIGLTTNIKNGIKYGHWGITIIALDYTQDSLFTDIENGKDFSNHCVNIILQNKNSSTNKTWSANTLEIQNAILISEILLKKLSLIIAADDSVSKELFIENAIQLLNGQLYSMEQRLFSEKKNFEWYFNEILNQKTLNFFLAPIYLFCKSTKCKENYDILKKSFLTLNECYSHWQFIDDVADLTKDTSDNLITTPGYILISQGQLAEKIQSLNLTESSDYLILHKIQKYLNDSKLLFDYYPLHTNHNPDSIYNKLLIALSNTSEEFNKELNELICDKINYKESFVKSFLECDWKGVLSQINNSNTCNRILATTFNPKKTQSLEDQLKGENERLKLSMYVLSLLMEKTYLKAVKTMH